MAEQTQQSEPARKTFDSGDEHYYSVDAIDFTPQGDCYPSPADWRDQILYELMIDRFDDGKDHPPFDAEKSKRGWDNEAGKKFCGGTIQGVIRRLDYIRGLGATAIWMTSPLKCRPGDDYGYHGYGTQDFLTVDPHFGKLDDFRELVRQAHKRGIYVLLDIVIEHTGDVWAYENGEDKQWDNGQQYPLGYWRRSHSGDAVQGEIGHDDAIWPIELQKPEAFKRVGRMREVSKANGDEAVDADFMSLKKIDLGNADALDTMVRIYKHWISTTDLDGFRIDAFRHTRPEAGAHFCTAIREYAARIGKKNFLLIGEVASSSDDMLKYVGGNTPLPEEAARRITRCWMRCSISRFTIRITKSSEARVRRSRCAIASIFWRTITVTWARPEKTTSHFWKITTAARTGNIIVCSTTRTMTDCRSSPPDCC